MYGTLKLKAVFPSLVFIREQEHYTITRLCNHDSVTGLIKSWQMVAYVALQTETNGCHVVLLKAPGQLHIEYNDEWNNSHQRWNKPSLVIRAETEACSVPTRYPNICPQKRFSAVSCQSGNIQTNVCDISASWEYHEYLNICIEDYFQLRKRILQFVRSLLDNCNGFMC